MKKSLKGALLSGLIFPGAGQLWLKHTARGLAFILAIALSLAVIVMKVAGQALALLEKIESEGGAVDLLAIVNSANASSYHDAVIKYATLALVLSWVVSVVDAYLLGTKKDMEDQGRVRRKETP